MIKDGQVRRLRSLLSSGGSLAVAARPRRHEALDDVRLTFRVIRLFGGGTTK